jgi:hypothetical protein
LIVIKEQESKKIFEPERKEEKKNRNTRISAERKLVICAVHQIFLGSLDHK